MTKEERQEREKAFTPEESITFNMLDKHTVEKLQRDGDIVLPKKKIDIPKDERWNTKQMSSKLLQGILNGDSIPKIANSLMDVIGNNRSSAVRNARTMTTSAENAGRLDSYKNLDAQGVVQKKVWMATPDDRTRPTHVDIDGEEQDINTIFSNGCMFPGDGKGPAEEVWNCRCTMRDHIVGFKRKDGSISYVKGDRGPTMHDEQMAEERERRGVEPAQELKSKNSRSEGDGTYGVDQLGHKYTKEEYEERLDALNEYEKYHYHATTINAINGIKKEGLKPSIGHAGEEIYMAKTKDSALEWTSSTSTGGNVAIRVKNTFLAKTDYLDYDHSIKGEGSTSTTIPLKELEVLASNGKWIPLKDAVVSYMRGIPTIILRPKGR